MSLKIKQWLAERHIKLAQLGHPGAEVSSIAFRMVQDMSVKSLTPFDLCSLTDVLELPLIPAWQIAKPVAQLTQSILRLLNRKKPLRRSEGTWLAFQVAYLNALQQILEQEAALRRPWINRSHLLREEDFDEPLVDIQLQAFLKTLRPGKLSDTQAEQALSTISNSLLVKQMNNLAIAWFIANGTEETEAKLIAQRLVNGLPGHLLTTITENTLALAQLQKFVGLGKFSERRRQEEGSEDFDPRLARDEFVINQQREEYRAQLLKNLSQPLMSDPFGLKDIYIPLKATPLQGDETEIGAEHKQVDLMEWAESQLEDLKTISLLEGESGLGKTSFCQIWAAQVAQVLYPEWMPVVIRLREVRLGKNLEQTLDSAFPLANFQDTDGWLGNSSIPCLLILDGLDELPPHPQRFRPTPEVLLEQIFHFQSQCLGSQPQKKHKIMVTARQLTPELLNRKHRGETVLVAHHQIKRVRIQPMGQEEWRKWFIHWKNLQSPAIAQAYFSFLKQEGLFTRGSQEKPMATLVRQPWMLYILGILYRDGLLEENLLQMKLPQAKFEIYDRTCRWLLGQPYPGSNQMPELVREGLAHAYRTPEAIAHLLGGRDPEQIRADIQQLAFKIWQTGDWSWNIGQNEEDVSYPLPAFFFHSLPSPRAEPTLPVPNPIPAIPHPNFPITFTHPSLGEFLSAEEIAQKLLQITSKVRDRYGETRFVLSSSGEVAQYIYQYLGYGVLSSEMQNLLVERLWREEQKNPQNFSFALLFERLYPFYQGYCYGRWLDEGLVNLAYNQLKNLGNSLNLLQVNAATGLNVFILLCVTSRLASIPFFPCGNPEQPEGFDRQRLLLFIGQSTVLSHSCFAQRIKESLTKIQLISASLPNLVLPQANFKKGNLSLAELSNANLIEANFKDANLTWANLAGANLLNANFHNANLEGTDLSRANLLGVDLSGAELKNTCLFATKLDEVNQNIAKKKGALFSLEEYEKYLSSLDSLTITEESLENDFPEVQEGVTWTIESVEGEPLLPKSAWDDTSFGTATGSEESTQALENLIPIDSDEEDEDNDDYDGATVML